MYIRNIFVFNAQPHDRMLINNKQIKNFTGNTSMEIDADLRVTFLEDFKTAVGEGILERLDSLVIDMNAHRGTDQTVEYKMLGRRNSINITYGSPMRPRR